VNIDLRQRKAPVDPHEIREAIIMFREAIIPVEFVDTEE
jgi:hypothetical protein